MVSDIRDILLEKENNLFETSIEVKRDLPWTIKRISHELTFIIS